MNDGRTRILVVSPSGAGMFPRRGGDAHAAAASPAAGVAVHRAGTGGSGQSPRGAAADRGRNDDSPGVLSYAQLAQHIAFCQSPAALAYDDPRTLHTYTGDGIPRTAGGQPYEPLSGWKGLRKV